MRDKIYYASMLYKYKYKPTHRISVSVWVLGTDERKLVPLDLS